MTHWKIDINDKETFSENFRNLSSESKEFVRDCIVDIVKWNYLDDYEYLIVNPAQSRLGTIEFLESNCFDDLAWLDENHPDGKVYEQLALERYKEKCLELAKGF